jgi:hypothetical protein
VGSERSSLFRRPALWLGVLGVGSLIGAGIGVAVGWRAAMERSLVSSRCRVLKSVDLQVDQIVDLKDRWKTYVRGHDEGAYLDISAAEATFLLRGESAVGIWLSGRGDRLDAKLTIPTVDGCYNVDFRGVVTVDAGVATLNTDRLEVGGRDLTDLAGLGGALGGTRQTVAPDDIEDPDVSKALSNIESLHVVDGRLRVRFADPSRVWR